jgi:hypothetical protein
VPGALPQVVEGPGDAFAAFATAKTAALVLDDPNLSAPPLRDHLEYLQVTG